jgi:SNF2 family DNA or RNA helicase
MVWCHLNDEATMLRHMIPNSIEISGADSEEKREEAAQWFQHGTDVRRVLISKPRIFGFGLNFQHCSHMTYFPSHSYEQYYQATRRLWRFGQTRPVLVDLIYTDGGERMMENLARKSQAADQMWSDLVKYMNQARSLSVTYKPIEVEVPSWMKTKS